MFVIIIIIIYDNMRAYQNAFMGYFVQECSQTQSIKVKASYLANYSNI